ncbi:putative Ig domain-containing protein [Pseudomonas oryzihabitans]|uniref:putative Ig domain-containing protein n=1 Tax=Pseudomonas oryzihabitans TaxID=47885 RepID=UPI003F59B30F
MTGSGGSAPYTYSATGLPAGLSLNTAAGTISGTPPPWVAIRFQSSSLMPMGQPARPTTRCP